jgi:hypothetical protein
MEYKALVLITGEYFEVDEVITHNYKKLPEGKIIKIVKLHLDQFKIEVEHDDGVMSEMHIPMHSIRYAIYH